MDFGLPANYKKKMKETERLDKYLDLARELEKKKMLMITIVVGAVKTVVNGNKRGWKSEEELRPYRQQQCQDWLEYSAKSWRSGGTCSHSDSSEKIPFKADVKNWQSVE